MFRSFFLLLALVALTSCNISNSEEESYIQEILEIEVVEYSEEVSENFYKEINTKFTVSTSVQNNFVTEITKLVEQAKDKWNFNSKKLDIYVVGANRRSVINLCDIYRNCDSDLEPFIFAMNGNEALIGVIYNFNNGEIYTAIQNQGAFLNNKKILVSDIASKSKASITTGFPASETIESSIKFLEDLKGWKKVRMFGSAALSCAYVASGKCDYYAEKGVYLWDIAAGICLVKEAGGYVGLKLIDKERYEVVFSNNLL